MKNAYVISTLIFLCETTPLASNYEILLVHVNAKLDLHAPSMNLDFLENVSVKST